MRLGITISPLDLLAYVAAVVAHPAYTVRFRRELEEPGIRVPLSTEPALWESAISLGREVIWLHTYGTRYMDIAEGRPDGERAIIERYGIKCTRAVRALPERLPSHLAYDDSTTTVHVGGGMFSPVPRRSVEYDVAGRRILWRWLNDRTRQPQYKKRTCPELDNLTVTSWDRRLTDELLALLAVLTGCISLEPAQRVLLNKVCDSATVTIDDLSNADVRLGSFALGRSQRPDDPMASALFTV